MDAPDPADSSPKKPLRRWFPPVLAGALALGLAVHLIGFLVVKVRAPEVREVEVGSPFVRYISPVDYRSDPLLEERAVLFDSAPLFIPTQWNASQSLDFLPARTATERFPEFLPDIDLVAALDPGNLAVGEEQPVREPSDLLAWEFWRFFEGFGQTAVESIPAESGGAVAEVWVLEDASRAAGAEVARSLPAELNFEGESGLPRPVTFKLRNSPSTPGLAAPLLAASSGDDAFDAAAREWLRRPSTLGALPVGYLSVRVFPAAGVAPPR